MKGFIRTKTGRGFPLIKFKDTYNVDCTIQESSSLTPRLWVGTAQDRAHLSRGQAWKIAWYLIAFAIRGRL